jgi:hypothetical protein
MTRFNPIGFSVLLAHKSFILTQQDCFSKQGEPLHLNVNIWQTRSNIPDSYGLCTINNVRKTCQSDVEQTDWPHVSFHFKLMIKHLVHSKIVQETKVNVSFFRQQKEVLKYYLLKIKVNSENITSMADIQYNFQTKLEANFSQLAETLDLSRTQVDEMIESLTSTTTTTIMAKPINHLALSLRFNYLSDLLN